MNQIFSQKCQILKYTGSLRSLIQMILINEKLEQVPNDFLVGHKSALILDYLFPQDRPQIKLQKILTLQQLCQGESFYQYVNKKFQEEMQLLTKIQRMFKKYYFDLRLSCLFLNFIIIQNKYYNIKFTQLQQAFQKCYQEHIKVEQDIISKFLFQITGWLSNQRDGFKLEEIQQELITEQNHFIQSIQEQINQLIRIMYKIDVSNKCGNIQQLTDYINSDLLPQCIKNTNLQYIATHFLYQNINITQGIQFVTVPIELLVKALNKKIFQPLNIPIETLSNQYIYMRITSFIDNFKLLQLDIFQIQNRMRKIEEKDQYNKQYLQQLQNLFNQGRQNIIEQKFSYYCGKLLFGADQILTNTQQFKHDLQQFIKYDFDSVNENNITLIKKIKLSLLQFQPSLNYINKILCWYMIAQLLKQDCSCILELVVRLANNQQLNKRGLQIQDFINIETVEIQNNKIE